MGELFPFLICQVVAWVGGVKMQGAPFPSLPTPHLQQTTSEVGGRSGPAVVRAELFCSSSAAALGRAALTPPRPCGRSGSEGVGVGEQNLREGEVAPPLPCSFL